MGFVDAHLRFTRLAAPAVIDPALLPREYIAVKFYAARSLPDTPEMRAYLRGLVASLSERLPVVLLDTGLVLEDDHADYALAAAGQVISARPWMTPRNNLGAQTQIVGGARAFVGTCGSIAWLAPRLGVDTSALFVDPKWLHAHLAVAMRAYHKLGAGQFAVADLRAVPILPSRDDSLHRPALHLLPELRLGDRRAGAARASRAPGRRSRGRAGRTRPGGRARGAASRRHRGRHADSRVGTLPARGVGLAARPRLPALLRRTLRGHAEDPAARLRPDTALRPAARASAGAPPPDLGARAHRGGRADASSASTSS